MRELALFAGAGGGILGGHLLGWRTICAVERDAYAAQVLAQRQNDGILRPFPIWSDVATFDGRPWRGLVDVVSGGFPCQDISAAGKGAGITGARSGMWKEMARIIGEVRPRFVFVENSPMLTTRGLGVVLGDLAALGFDAEWGVLSAADVGANHRRERIWILGYSNSGVRRSSGGGRVEGHLLHQAKWQEGSNQTERSSIDGAENMADANNLRQLQPTWSQQNKRTRIGDGSEDVSNSLRKRLQDAWPVANGANGRKEWRKPTASNWWSTEPDVGRVADGVAFRVDRLKAIGNGQVPAVAATAFELLRARFKQ